MQGLLDELGVIGYFTESGKSPIPDEVLKNKRTCIQQWGPRRYTLSIVWRHREFKLYRFLFVRPKVCLRACMFLESNFLQIPSHDKHTCL